MPTQIRLASDFQIHHTFQRACIRLSFLINNHTEFRVFQVLLRSDERIRIMEYDWFSSILLWLVYCAVVVLLFDVIGKWLSKV